MDIIFNPFENRLCRDIRNNLGHGFIKAIQANTIKPFQSAASPYQSKPAGSHIETYIRNRMEGLKKIIDEISLCPLQSDDDFKIAGLLWNLELFFEFHEWLEEKWLTAKGSDKKALQALILAAVVYEQLEYGRKTPAEKVASKAILLFENHRNSIPEPFDTNLIILKLTGLDPAPPKFNLNGMSP